MPEPLTALLTLEITTNSGQGKPSVLEKELFQNLITLPLYTFNLGALTLNNTDLELPEKFNSTEYYTKRIFRVLISNYSLYIFTAFALSTLIWCCAIFWYCWSRRSLAPNVSCFPEVDFATKYAVGTPYLFQGLGNACSRDIEHIVGRQIFVGATKDRDKYSAHIVLSVDRDMDSLVAGKKYL
jgi:hypothetical protein